MSKPEYAFGIHTVQALLERQPERITRLLCQNTRHDVRLDQLIQLAKRTGVVVDRLSSQELNALVGGATHQGVVAVCQSNVAIDEASLPQLLETATKPVLIVILDGVQDPHNLGACLRSANAFGATAVIAPKDRAVGLTPAARKAASGAEATLPFIQVTNLARTMRYLQEQNIWLVGASANATTLLQDQDLTGSIGLVFGSEGTGMRQLTERHCDFIVHIPMSGSVESLNVSVACGIGLYEVQRQRRSR